MDLGLRILESSAGHHLTRFAGWAASKRLPRVFLAAAIRRYCRHYEIDMAEAVREEPEDYSTFIDFFTRELKPEARPMASDPDAWISPVDGRVSQAGHLDPGALIQAKGLTYTLEGLLGGPRWASGWDGGIYVNLYLSPADYHRIHAPADMAIHQAIHIPGNVLPVNDWSRTQVPGLYTGNERIILRASVRGQNMLLVLIAAVVVGKVRLQFDPLTTHDGTKLAAERYFPEPIVLKRGEEIGRFELGSTVILLLQPGLGSLDGATPGNPVRFGQKLGRL